MKQLNVSLRSNTELWDLETSTSTVISPSFPVDDYNYGGSFLLGAHECRRSSKLSIQIKSTVKF